MSHSFFSQDQGMRILPPLLNLSSQTTCLDHIGKRVSNKNFLICQTNILAYILIFFS